MKINQHNYEEFFIDYLDGNLSDSQIIELENFLLQHPELREELEDMENIVISEENIHFHKKESLLQPDISLPVTKENIEYFLIAESEGDLDEEHQVALNNFLSDKQEYTNDKDIYSKLKLHPDTRIKYPNKPALKKSISVQNVRYFCVMPP